MENEPELFAKVGSTPARTTKQLESKDINLIMTPEANYSKEVVNTVENGAKNEFPLEI